MIKDTLFYINYTGPHKILSFIKTHYATLIKIEYADSGFVTQITLAPPDFVLCVRTCLIEPQSRLTWQKELSSTQTLVITEDFKSSIRSFI